MAVAAKIATDFIVDLPKADGVLGEFGDQWLAQQSLRTPTTVAAGGLDIKLPLTIYNTSCYRGSADTSLPASRWLQQVFCDRRHPSAKRRSGILGEPAAGYVSHEGYAALARLPYRYQKCLVLSGGRIRVAETG